MTRSALVSPEPLDHRPISTTVTAHVVGRRTVVRVSGEIDMATVPLLADAIEAALAAGALELWIDLTLARFMDSSGVHVLLTADERARKLNRRLAVICPRGPVRRLFEVAGVSSQLPILEDRAAAQRESLARSTKLG
jgi:anti-sigma B factor antagonist